MNFRIPLIYFLLLTKKIWKFISYLNFGHLNQSNFQFCSLMVNEDKLTRAKIAYMKCLHLAVLVVIEYVKIFDTNNRSV